MSRIDNKLHEQVMQKVFETVTKINAHYHLNMKVPLVSYDLTGTTAGIARYATMSVHLQPKLLLDNIDDFIENTIPHEICHLGVWAKYIHEKKKVAPKAHGAEWKLMMYVVGASSRRTHDYDVQTVRKSSGQYRYACQCPEDVTVSKVMHHKIKNGRYSCKKCGTLLKDGERVMTLSFSRPSPNGTTNYES